MIIIGYSFVFWLFYLHINLVITAGKNKRESAVNMYDKQSKVKLSEV